MSKQIIKETNPEKHVKPQEIILFVCMVLFFCLDIFCCNYFHFFNLFPHDDIRSNVVAAANVVMEMFGMAVCGFLYISVFIDDRHSRFRDLLLKLLFFENLILFLDSFSWFIGGKPEFNTLLIIVNCLFYICAGIIFITFWGTEIEVMNLSHIKKVILYGIRVLAILYFISVILNLKFGFYYRIIDGNYYRNRFSWIEYLFPLIVCLVILYYAIRVKIFWKVKAPYILMVVFPILTILLQSVAYSLSFMYISVLAAIIVLYINVQVDMGRKIEEYRNRVMISQIQPHFMYNTLTTIKALCRVDPDLASKTITNFADYLRGNMDFASLETTIPLEQELKHTKIYTEIEALRFDNITFEFDIQDQDFQVPALVIQPMVENAVRHGVRSRKDGHILVQTYSEEKYHVIIIKDNGKGFDNAQFNGSRTHIGLLNTRLRIERIVNGIFEVDSVPEKGVTITIRIPK